MEQNSVGGAARGRDNLRGSWTSTASVPLRAWRRSLTAFVMGREVSRTCRAAARVMETLERLRTLTFPLSRHWCVARATLAHRPSRSACPLSRYALRPRALHDFPMCRQLFRLDGACGVACGVVGVGGCLVLHTVN